MGVQMAVAVAVARRREMRYVVECLETEAAEVAAVWQEGSCTS